jgi:hypothetical protein
MDGKSFTTSGSGPNVIKLFFLEDFDRGYTEGDLNYAQKVL